MKRAFAAVLALLLAFSLFACGETQNKTTSPAQTSENPGEEEDAPVDLFAFVQSAIAYSETGLEVSKAGEQKITVLHNEEELTPFLPFFGNPEWAKETVKNNAEKGYVAVLEMRNSDPALVYSLDDLSLEDGQITVSISGFSEEEANNEFVFILFSFSPDGYNGENIVWNVN